MNAHPVDSILQNVLCSQGRIGSGGHACVYRATCNATGRTYAVKATRVEDVDANAQEAAAVRCCVLLAESRKTSASNLSDPHSATHVIALAR